MFAHNPANIHALQIRPSRALERFLILARSEAIPEHLKSLPSSQD